MSTPDIADRFDADIFNSDDFGPETLPPVKSPKKS